MARTSKHAVGTIGGYTILRRERLERLDGAYLELEHERTGARHIHIECPDDNNAFAVFFATAPNDSTGVAHVLEHVVLAGWVAPRSYQNIPIWAPANPDGPADEQASFYGEQVRAGLAASDPDTELNEREFHDECLGVAFKQEAVRRHR